MKTQHLLTLLFLILVPVVSLARQLPPVDEAAVLWSNRHQPGDVVKCFSTADPILKTVDTQGAPYHLYATKTFPAGFIKHQKVSAVYDPARRAYIIDNLYVSLIQHNSLNQAFESFRIVPMSHYVFDALRWETKHAPQNNCDFQGVNVFDHARVDVQQVYINIPVDALGQYIQKDQRVYLVGVLVYTTGWIQRNDAQTSIAGPPGRTECAPNERDEDYCKEDDEGNFTKPLPPLPLLLPEQTYPPGAIETRVIYFPFAVKLSPDAQQTPDPFGQHPSQQTSEGPIKELVISSGDNQIGTPNKDLPNPISVQVLGEDGVGVPYVRVYFRVVSGTARMRHAGGPKTFRRTSVFTDKAGYAKALVTPVNTKMIKIRAYIRSNGDGVNPVVFTVNPEQAGSAPSSPYKRKLATMWSALKTE